MFEIILVRVEIADFFFVLLSSEVAGGGVGDKYPYTTINTINFTRDFYAKIHLESLRAFLRCSFHVKVILKNSIPGKCTQPNTRFNFNFNFDLIDFMNFATTTYTTQLTNVKLKSIAASTMKIREKK
jgi:hypothetical protein